MYDIYIYVYIYVYIYDNKYFLFIYDIRLLNILVL